MRAPHTSCQSRSMQAMRSKPLALWRSIGRCFAVVGAELLRGATSVWRRQAEGLFFVVQLIRMGPRSIGSRGVLIRVAEWVALGGCGVASRAGAGGGFTEHNMHTHRQERGSTREGARGGAAMRPPRRPSGRSLEPTDTHQRRTSQRREKRGRSSKEGDAGGDRHALLIPQVIDDGPERAWTGLRPALSQSESTDAAGQRPLVSEAASGAAARAGCDATTQSSERRRRRRQQK